MVQAGPAFTSRANFIATLSSYVIADLSHVAASGATLYRYATTPLTIWGGLAQMGSEVADTKCKVLDRLTAGSGRFNTSADAFGNWFEAAYTWKIVLGEHRNAFACTITDIGDLGGTVSFQFLDGATVVDSYVLSTTITSTSQFLQFCYGNGNIQFNTVRVIITQSGGNPTFFDGIGFDDLMVGQVLACTPA